MITPSEQTLYLRRLRFPAELELRYHVWQYANVRSVLRVAVVPVIAFALFSGVRDLLYARVPFYAFNGNGAVIVLCLLLFGLTFARRFEKVWQPVTVLLVWLAMTIMLNSPIVTGTRAVPAGGPRPVAHPLSSGFDSGRQAEPSLAPPPSPPSGSRAGSRNQMLLVQLYILMIFMAAFRLGFGWAMLLNFGLLASAYWVQSVRLQESSLMYGERTLLVLFALMISSLVQERLSRSAFLANYLLDQERDKERQKRERTEGMLHVLGQAIGGIVHDLGNPINVVQNGAQLLEEMIGEDNDPATLKELIGMIEEGAKMLNYQRLSLMEQTRILEGKPIPVERKFVSLRRIIATGIRYQKSNLAYGRQVVIDGDDLQICVDEMKLTSVLINLIGNAMKYSDGEIRVCWRTQADKTWVAVFDQGRAGQGISESQARSLFVAFGRLESHEQIEGTGLGLLSVRKILEAHGGEVYIEGHRDGQAGSAIFSTAQSASPSMLNEGFLTAFVLVCPNQVS